MADTVAKQRAREKVLEKRDIRAELDQLESLIAELKIQYEQYFAGVLPLPPDKLHLDVKRKIQSLMRAPFKSTAMKHRLRAIESRYRTFNTYWQRVLKQREEGTYTKDIFKAAMREKMALEEAKSQTAGGAAQRHMQELFNSYRSALEKQTGRRQDNLNYKAFEASLLKRAKDFKKKHGDAKLSFKVAVKNGKVTVQVKAKKKAVSG